MWKCAPSHLNISPHADGVRELIAFSIFTHITQQ
jgi:hypothetical protein